MSPLAGQSEPQRRQLLRSGPAGTACRARGVPTRTSLTDWGLRSAPPLLAPPKPPSLLVPPMIDADPMDAVLLERTDLPRFSMAAAVTAGTPPASSVVRPRRRSVDPARRRAAWLVPVRGRCRRTRTRLYPLPRLRRHQPSPFAALLRACEAAARALRCAVVRRVAPSSCVRSPRRHPTDDVTHIARLRGMRLSENASEGLCVEGHFASVSVRGVRRRRCAAPSAANVRAHAPRCRARARRTVQ